jgi:hypothetical protein
MGFVLEGALVLFAASCAGLMARALWIRRRPAPADRYVGDADPRTAELVRWLSESMLAERSRSR